MCVCHSAVSGVGNAYADGERPPLLAISHMRSLRLVVLRMSGPLLCFGLGGLWRLGGNQFLQGHYAAGEIPNGKHVFRGYTVVSHLAHTPHGYTEMQGKGGVATALFIKPWFEFHDSTLVVTKAIVK